MTMKTDVLYHSGAGPFKAMAQATIGDRYVEDERTITRLSRAAAKRSKARATSSGSVPEGDDPDQLLRLIDLVVRVVANPRQEHSSDGPEFHSAVCHPAKRCADKPLHSGFELVRDQIGGSWSVCSPPRGDRLNLRLRPRRNLHLPLGHQPARSLAMKSAAWMPSPRSNSAWPARMAVCRRARSSSSSSSPSSMTESATSVPSGRSMGSSTINLPPCTCPRKFKVMLRSLCPAIQGCNGAWNCKDEPVTRCANGSRDNQSSAKPANAGVLGLVADSRRLLTSRDHRPAFARRGMNEGFFAWASRSASIRRVNAPALSRAARSRRSTRIPTAWS